MEEGRMEEGRMEEKGMEEKGMEEKGMEKQKYQEILYSISQDIQGTVFQGFPEMKDRQIPDDLEAYMYRYTT